MNNWTIAGRLGRDAETRTTSGDHVTNFTVAVDEYAGHGEKRALWVDCSMWGERGEKLAEYLTKGTAVSVSGRAGVRTYESRSNGETVAVMTMTVMSVTLLGSRQDGERPARGEERQGNSGGRAGTSAGPRQQPKPTTTPAEDFSDDDIPF